jgi:hypothetical protein
LQVHHRDYSRLGHEDPEDLTVLCARCHKAFSYKFTPARQAAAVSEYGSEFVERSKTAKSAWQSREAKARNKRKAAQTKPKPKREAVI